MSELVNQEVGKQQEQETILDISLAQVPVKLRMLDGTVKTYIVREMPGDKLEAFMQENKDRMDVVMEGTELKVRGIKSYQGMFAGLLGRCLCSENGQLVPIEVINTFPGRVQQILCSKAQKLNALTPEAEDKAGN